jgi:hypothetical protein
MLNSNTSASREHDMPAVTSADGTMIAYERSGSGGLQRAAKATAEALPNAEHRTLDGQTHDVAPDARAPVLVEFFGA